MPKHYPDLTMCQKQRGIAVGRLCEKCDSKCVNCKSYVLPCTMKLYILKDKLTRFKMQEGESILEMFHRLNVIINELRNLGDKVSDEDFSHRFLRCLPPRFDTLVKIILRGGLKGISPTQVLGDVMTDEAFCVGRDGVDQEEEKKKKSVAFKATTSSSKNKGKKKKVESSDDDGSSSNDEDDEEMTLFVRRFGKFLKKEGYGARRKRSSSSSKNKGNKKKVESSDDEGSSSNDEDDELTALFVRRFGKFLKEGHGARRRRSSSKRKEKRRCYKCGSQDHLIADCPQNSDNEKNDKKEKKKDKESKKMTLMKNKKKDHSYCVTWDSDASSSVDDDDDKKTTKKKALTSIDINTKPPFIMLISGSEVPVWDNRLGKVLLIDLASE